MGKNNIGVSVIVLTYNAVWEKLEATLKSILKQENVGIEIVIADDGSKTRHDEKILNLFESCGFSSYVFSNLKQNVGTCKNLHIALDNVTGKYVKTISPGDVFFSSNSLSQWKNFMDETKCEASFCDAVYYSICDGDLKVFSLPASPKFPELFDSHCRNSSFVDYLLANDTILGASIMMKVDAIRHYVGLIVDHVRYAEDYMIRLMVFENKNIRHYAQNGIFYEYGLGISTSKNQAWGNLLREDFYATDGLILEYCKPIDKIARRYIKYLKFSKKGIIRKIYKCLLFPTLVWWRLKAHINHAKTLAESDINFLKSVI